VDVVVNASRLVLGTVQWGLPYGIANRGGVPSEATVARLLERAALSGVTGLDTARAYGESEAVLGRVAGGDARWQIVTKLPPLKLRGASPSVARDAVDHALDESLRALRRDRVAAVLLHDPSDRLAANGAVWRALLARRDGGATDAVGISARSPSEALEALDDESIAAIQVASSLLDPRLLRAGFFTRARAARKKVFVRSVFLQGAASLDPRALPPHLAKLEPALAAIARWGGPRGLSAPEVCLLYARDAFDASLVVGMESERQLDANLRTWALPPLGDATLAELAGAIPELPESVVDPSKWPTPR
jgi:spore coat polysaccharide biosynthesis protein SpsF